MALLDDLNPMQRQAASQTEGPLLILAGAGSGKTRVLVHRIAHLMQQGVAPFHILAITFTNKAAKEMRERVDALVPQGGQVWVSTFHALCARLLRQDIKHLGYDSHFTIYDADDSERVIKRCIKALNINDKQFPPKSVAAAISGFKNELYTPSDVAADYSGDYRIMEINKIYKLYQKQLKDNNGLDFDDMIMLTIKLLTDFPEVLEKYQNRFRYIMVDEYQDTNTAQYTLVKLLAKKHGNLCVVGDDDQSIYGWRGANIRNILDFERDNKNAKLIKLEQNYRSTQTILDAANTVISYNRNRKVKNLWTDKAGGTPIYVYKANYDYEEAHFVAEQIKTRAEAGASFKDFAVLYRTNAQSRSIEEQLISKNLPYRIFGGVRFYDRKEIKDILAYLRVINNPLDSVSLLRIINVPRRGIGEASVDKVAEYATAMDMSFFDALKDLDAIPGLGARQKKLVEFRALLQSFIEFAKTHTVTEVMNEILEQINIVGELMLEGTDEAMGRIENIQELLSKAAEFEAVSEDKQLTAFLEELALVADIDQYAETEDTVSLMTLHSAKGLEFPCVFMVGMEEGIFPSYRSITSGDIKDLEEERRICYVGITRAKETLYVTAAASRRQHGQVVYNKPSRFLEEMPENLMQETTLPVDDSGKKERTGISQYAEINKVKHAIDISFGGKNYMSAPKQASPDNVSLDFAVGDQVRQMKYGVGVVKDIRPAGPDYEVAVEFEGVGVKKFMAHLSKLKKV